MSYDKVLKAALILSGAVAGAIVADEFFPAEIRAYAKVVAAGAGALLAYVLNPKATAPQEVTGPDGGPVKTQETNQGN